MAFTCFLLIMFRLEPTTKSVQLIMVSLLESSLGGGANRYAPRIKYWIVVKGCLVFSQYKPQYANVQLKFY